MVSPRSFSRFLAFSFFLFFFLTGLFSSMFEICLDIQSRDIISFMGTLLK